MIVGVLGFPPLGSTGYRVCIYNPLCASSKMSAQFAYKRNVDMLLTCPSCVSSLVSSRCKRRCNKAVGRLKHHHDHRLQQKRCLHRRHHQTPSKQRCNVTSSTQPLAAPWQGFLSFTSSIKSRSPFFPLYFSSFSFLCLSQRLSSNHTKSNSNNITQPPIMSQTRTQSPEVTGSSKEAPKKHMILNDLFTPQALPHLSRPRTFAKFSLLPPEIRLQIWNACMVQPLASRFISIALCSDRSTKSKPYRKKNSLGNIISSHSYYIRQDSVRSEWFDALDQVNQESRNAYRLRYRVRFPISVKSADGDKFHTAHISFNPETDILHLTSHPESHGLSLLHCIHDIIAHDPRGIGVAHLAMGGHDHLSYLSRLYPSDLPLHAQEQIKQWLSGSLQSFYTVIQMGMTSRDIDMMLFPSRQSEDANDLWHCNRSLPILASTTHYTRTTKDMRSVDKDLTYIAAPTDPRESTQMWNQFRANFGKEKEELQLRYLMGLSEPSQTVATRQDLCYFLDKSNAHWEKIRAKLKATGRHQALLDDDYWSQRTIPQVAGLWNFPADAFGTVPPLDAGFTDWRYKYVFDISHIQPELWVFHLVE